MDGSAFMVNTPLFSVHPKGISDVRMITAAEKHRAQLGGGGGDLTYRAAEGDTELLFHCGAGHEAIQAQSFTNTG